MLPSHNSRATLNYRSYKDGVRSLTSYQYVVQVTNLDISRAKKKQHVDFRSRYYRFRVHQREPIDN